MTSSNHSLPSTLKSYEEEEAETFLNPAKYMTPKRKKTVYSRHSVQIQI